MLFDLRARGRRRTIQAIYLGLAVLMGGGLVLFGVGAGNGTGGLLNAFSPSGGGSAAKEYVSQATKNAEKQAKLQPDNPQVWANLAQARYDDASDGFDSTTNAFSASGKKDLAGAGQAWQRYLQLDKHPDTTLARVMAEAYSDIDDYTHEAQAWQFVAAGSPTVAVYWEYVAEAAYEAKNDDLGSLAEAKAVSLVPKAQRAEIKAQLEAAKAQTATTTT